MGLSSESSLPSPDDRLSSIRDLELVEDDRHVVADRLGAKEELARDLAIGGTRRDEVEDLALPGGELGEGLARALAGGEVVQDSLPDAGPKIVSPLATARIARRISPCSAPFKR